MKQYCLSRDMVWSVDYVGVERSPVLVIDNLCAEPESLLQMAEAAHFIDIGPTYPGVRAPAAAGYGDWILGVFQAQIRDIFGGTAPWGFDLCAYSMVTTPPGALTALQSLPHFDGVETTRLAFLHYLCGEAHGGTSFYRQRSTGFERVHPERLDTYLDTLREDSVTLQAPGYATGTSPIFERIGGVEARFNRAVFYPGSLLHSGDILAPHLLGENVRTGRLTINGFVVLETDT